MSKLLLGFPNDYAVRAITRDPTSKAAQALQAAGAEVFQADQNTESQMEAAFRGCYGVFAVTTSYDPVGPFLQGAGSSTDLSTAGRHQGSSA